MLRIELLRQYVIERKKRLSRFQTSCSHGICGQVVWVGKCSTKTALITLTSHTSEAGAGVKVTHFWKAGSVDYKKIPELKDVDLEQYRGKARQEVRITVA